MLSQTNQFDKQSYYKISLFLCVSMCFVFLFSIQLNCAYLKIYLLINYNMIKKPNKIFNFAYH